MALLHYIVFSIFSLYLVKGVDWDTKTPLDEYIARPDPAYTWRYVQTYRNEEVGCNVYIVNMTSQKWKDENVTTLPVWSHYVTIFLPDQLNFSDTAFMWIAGGSNPSNPPDPDRDDFMTALCSAAVDLSVVGVYLRQIPNQPFYFIDDPNQQRMSEDRGIAYTWRKFIENPNDPEILLRMPMVKAGVRAFDTATAVVAEQLPGTNVSRFIVSGGSKRGWVAWLLAATDRRVIGAAPIVLSALNFRENLHHHYRAYGGWSYVMNDYWRQNVTQFLTDPVVDDMAKIIDPYEYRERLTMPKLIVVAGGDEFFLPDDSHYFYDALLEPKHMLFLDNTHHPVTLSEFRVYSAIIAYFYAVLTNHPIPELRWVRNETELTGSITLWTNTDPVRVSSWMTNSGVNDSSPVNLRDFRWATVHGFRPIFWDEFVVEEIDDNVYQAEFFKTYDFDETWRAFVINAIYDSNHPDDFFEFDLTTEVNIIPDTFPFPRCQSPQECYGTLK